MSIIVNLPDIELVKGVVPGLEKHFTWCGGTEK